MRCRGLRARRIPFTHPVVVRPRQRRAGDAGHKFFTTIPGGLDGDVFFFDNDLHNIRVCIETRILGCYLHGKPVELEPQPPEAWCMNEFSRYLAGRLRCVTPLSLAASAAEFTGPRRAVYQAALEEVTLHGFQQKHMKLRCFLKAEAYEKATADPRGIRPRHPCANIVFGQVIFPATPVLKKALNDWFRKKYGFASPIALSGMSRGEIATHLAEGIASVPDAVLVRLDGARFDRHVRRPSIRWTHNIYRAMRCPTDALRFMAFRERNEVNIFLAADGMVRFGSEPTRCSGDDDTWLGNTLIACRIIDWWCKKLVAAGCRTLYAADSSDDMLLVVPRRFVQTVVQLVEVGAAKFGFSFEVELVSSQMSEMRWAQSVVIHDGSNYRLVRDIPRTLRRAFVTDRPIHEIAEREAWFSAVAIGGLIEYGDIPLLRALFRRLLELSNGAAPALLRSEEYRGVSGEALQALARERSRQPNGPPSQTARKERLARFLTYYREPTEETWEAVTATYGWGRRHMLEVEAELAKITIDGVEERSYDRLLVGRVLYF